MTTILATAPTMDLSGIQTAMTSAFKQVQTGASDMITAAVPFCVGYHWNCSGCYGRN